MGDNLNTFRSIKDSLRITLTDASPVSKYVVKGEVKVSPATEAKKRLLNDIHFLTMYGDLCDTVVYIGEDDCSYLSKLFPSHNFVLIRDLSIPVITSSSPDKITVIATDINTPIALNTQRPLLISYIGGEAMISCLTQVKWVETLSPIVCSLQFNCSQNRPTVMLEGSIQLQPWVSPSDISTRLIAHGPYRLKEYNSRLYLDQLQGNIDLNVGKLFDKSFETVILGDFLLKFKQYQRTKNLMEDINSISVEINDYTSKPLPLIVPAKDARQSIISLLDIDLMTPVQVGELSDIVSNPDTMQMIGDGKPWDIDYINELMGYSVKDRNKPNRQYYYWAIIESTDTQTKGPNKWNKQKGPVGHVVGIVGLHPVPKNLGSFEGRNIEGLQIMIAVSPSVRGKGISQRAMKQVLSRVGFGIWILTRVDNEPMIKSAIKLGSTRSPEPVKIKGNPYELFWFAPPQNQQSKRQDAITQVITKCDNKQDIITVEQIPLSFDYFSVKSKRRSHHVGQYKLFISEIKFLNQYAPWNTTGKVAPMDRKDKFVVIYAGSAPGHHDAFLCHMFKSMRMILIDPRPHNIKNVGNLASSFNVVDQSLYYKFSTARTLKPSGKCDDERLAPTGTKYVNKSGNIVTVEETDPSKALGDTLLVGDPMGINESQRAECANRVIADITADFQNDSDRRLYIIEDFFTMGYSETFEKLNALTTVLYISDIRLNINDLLSTGQEEGRGESCDIGDSDPTPSDLDIIANNAQQHLWINALQPVASMLKYRAPFHNPKEIKIIEAFKKNDPSARISADKLPMYKDVIEQYEKTFKHNIIDEYLADNEQKSQNKGYYWVDTKSFELQVFQGSSSTETRAIIEKQQLNQPQLQAYSRISYENRLFAYNVIREYLFYEKNMRYFNKELGIDGCADCNILIATFKEYIGKDDPDTIIEYIKNSLKSIARKLTYNDYDSQHGEFIETLSVFDALKTEEMNRQDYLEYTERTRSKRPSKRGTMYRKKAF